MTQVAFVRSLEIPSVQKIEKDIQNLGYDFKINNKEDEIISSKGFECVINGYATYFETYIEEPAQVASELEFITTDLTNEDLAIAFVWGADFAAGACIGLISIALIDHCDAKIFYLDDEMIYTREMLLDDIPAFLNELNKIKNPTSRIEIKKNKQSQKQGFWNRLKAIFQRKP